jgi:membrane protease YdiL (CAAX protease family)
MTDKDSGPDVDLLSMGLLVEGGLFGIALLLGWLGFCDQHQPLQGLDWAAWQSATVWGLVATLPMLVYLGVFHFWKPAFFQPMRQFVETNLKPMFSGASVPELLLLSVMAGFGEELFFRWCLQGGITLVLESQIGIAAAIGVGLGAASLVFGGCHWVNASYGITTMLVGGYLGLTMIWSGSWLVPAIAHALFDFAALIYIVNLPAKR